jgi:peptide deformylase
MGAGELPVQRASLEFVAEFTRWRLERGLSKKQLAAAMGFDPSYVSHIEANRHRPTEDFARRAEMILKTDGTLWERFKQYDELRIGARVASRGLGASDSWWSRDTGLVVDRETANLSFLGSGYRCTVRRALFNAGSEPVTRYPVRISIDRYPDDPERSNRHHRQNPLTWEELSLSAACDVEPMRWRAKTDRDAFKEAWLLFENDRGRFPLYPGQRTTIEYSYQVNAEKWGPYFQRAVRLLTRSLSIEVDFPADLRPSVWGVETSLSSETPLRTPIKQRFTADGRVVYSWHTDSPTLHAWYRLGWRFGDESPALRASERMRSAGIVQRGAGLLRARARRFDLPREAGAAAEAITRLSETLDRIQGLHRFAKGVGLCAPQIGIGRSVALVRPPGGNAIVLLNPRVIAESAERDEQYEGCLSFFDVRGLVPRPLQITVEHDLPTGERVVDTYQDAVARLVSHEADHLKGLLYVDRLASDDGLVAVDDYRDSGRPWRY